MRYEAYVNRMEWRSQVDFYTPKREVIDNTPMTAVERGAAYTAAREEAKREFLAWRKEYSDEDARVIALFREDAEREHGFDHFPQPLKDKIHEIAYAEGHSGGFASICAKYEGLIGIADAVIHLYGIKL